MMNRHEGHLAPARGTRLGVYSTFVVLFADFRRVYRGSRSRAFYFATGDAVSAECYARNVKPHSTRCNVDV